MGKCLNPSLAVRDDSHMDGAVYIIDVKGGFYLDEFVAQGGASSDAELISFIRLSIQPAYSPSYFGRIAQSYSGVG